MKVILLEDIERLGKMGDVVTVKDGFARNFLIPNKKAKTADAGSVKVIEGLKKKKSVQDAKVLEEAKALAQKLGAISLTIDATAGEEEKLFGSVSNEMIATALSEQEEIKVDKKDITIDEPIKKLGVYQVAVKLHPEVKASLRVWVVSKTKQDE